MRRLLILAVLAFGVWYFAFRKETPPTSSADVPPPSSPAGECLRLADLANGSLAAASAVASRPPADPNEWSRVESDARSALSAAEGACSSSPDVTKALGLMRESLSEFASAAKGQGGATAAAQRQEQIYDLLNRARGR